MVYFRFINRLAMAFGFFASFYYRLFPLDKRKILMSSTSRRFASNAKYVALELIRRRLPCELVWVVDPRAERHADEFPSEIHLVRNLSFAFWRNVCTSGIWLDETLRNEIRRKRKGQKFIQIWHGSFGIKRLFNHAKKPWPPRVRTLAGAITDYCISNSAFETEKVYRGTFWPQTPVLEWGHPRNDILLAASEVREAVRVRVRERYGLTAGERILLYMPTFRECHYERRRGAAFVDAPLDFDADAVLTALKKRFNGMWMLASRRHPRMRDIHWRFAGAGRMLDWSDEADPQEMLLAADALLSDYSSALFDFLLTGRPAFIFTITAEHEPNERTLYYPVERTPFPIAHTTEELCSAIRTFDEAVYALRTKEFLTWAGNRETGRACGKVADLIEELLA